MRIHVTQKHIDSGERRSSTRCMVALAVQAVLPDAIVHVNTTMRTVAVEMGRKFCNVPISKKASDRATAFDEFGPSAVLPFSFVLNLESGAPRRIAPFEPKEIE